MNISSRGQLMELINKMEVDSFSVEESEVKKTVNTIIHCKKRNMFYRLIWGEMKDRNGVFHLWYEDEAEKVVLSESGESWLTKEELKKHNEEKEINVMNSSVSSKEKLIENLTFFKRDNVEIVGSPAGKGKTTYALTMAAEALTKGESVLIITRELTAIEGHRMIVETPMDKLLRSESELVSLKENSKLTIDNNQYSINFEDVEKKIVELSNRPKGLDLVIIDDSLDFNSESIETVSRRANNLSEKYNCKMTITIQINDNYYSNE